MFFFDSVIMMAVNQYSQQSWLFDHAMAFLQGTNLLKGGIFMALCWGAWFSPGNDVAKKRQILLTTFAGAFLALGLARGLAEVLPFQLRPAIGLAPLFHVPFGIKEALKEWNSFPSDHAALFSALATGLWLISRRLGIVGVIYAFIFILLPRIYCGLHYPSDIMAGSFLGVASVLLLLKLNNLKPLFNLFLTWSEKYRSIFYGAAFLLTYQLATLFDDLRDLGSGIIKIIKLYPGP
jgi:undecaprenyl-diphosphatase